MPQYEIMIIADPKSDAQQTEKFVKDIFGTDVKKFEKMSNTELKYEINNSTTAHYFLADVNTTGEHIKEFTRKSNIEKFIWRQLVINIDSERAYKTKDAVPKRGPRKDSRFERTSRPRVGVTPKNE